MRPSKKSSLITFCCSFIPGAAEMYMGFMKNGLSIMSIFFLSMMVPSFFGLSDSFIFVTAIIWFYGFFHARNIANSLPNEFAFIEDQFVWEEFTNGKKFSPSSKRLRQWLGIIVIILGCSQLWRTFEKAILRFVPNELWDYAYEFLHNVPQFIFAIIFIIVGVLLIKGKKRDLDMANEIPCIEDKEAK